MIDGEWMTADDPLFSAIAIERADTSTLVHRNGTVMAYPQDDFELMMALWKGTDGHE